MVRLEPMEYPMAKHVKPKLSTVIRSSTVMVIPPFCVNVGFLRVNRYQEGAACQWHAPSADRSGQRRPHKVLLWKQKGPTAIRVDGTCPTLYHKITNGSIASVRNGRCFSYALRRRQR